MPRRKLSDEDAQALVLAGLKSEVPVAKLCRRHAVGEVTCRKLRDRFIATGMKGLYSSGHARHVQAMEDRTRDLERALGRKRGIVVNHTRMRRLMQMLGWTRKCVAKGRRGGVARPGDPSGPNQVWQIDMTMVLVEGPSWLHHIAVVDAFAREVVGHFEGMRARSVEWLQALDQAVLDRFPGGRRGQGLTTQAASGCQPTARAFRDALHILGIQLAFIDLREPKQNAIVERCFRTLKGEEIWPTIYETVDQARAPSPTSSATTTTSVSTALWAPSRRLTSLRPLRN